jgi:hypothetical protein
LKTPKLDRLRELREARYDEAMHKSRRAKKQTFVRRKKKKARP